jgi:hypothetical protein
LHAPPSHAPPLDGEPESPPELDPELDEPELDPESVPDEEPESDPAPDPESGPGGDEPCELAPVEQAAPSMNASVLA